MCNNKKSNYFWVWDIMDCFQWKKVGGGGVVAEGKELSSSWLPPTENNAGLMSQWLSSQRRLAPDSIIPDSKESLIIKASYEDW